MLRKLLALVSALLISSAAYGATAPAFVTAPPTSNMTLFTSADTPGTFKTIYTAGASGGKCVSSTLHWNDQGAAHVVTLAVTIGADTLQAASLTTTAGGSAGTLGTPLNFFDPGVWAGLPADGVGGNPVLLLPAGAAIKATYTTAVTAAYQVGVYVQCADF